MKSALSTSSPKAPSSPEPRDILAKQGVSTSASSCESDDDQVQLTAGSNSHQCKCARLPPVKLIIPKLPLPKIVPPLPTGSLQTTLKASGHEVKGNTVPMPCKVAGLQQTLIAQQTVPKRSTPESLEAALKPIVHTDIAMRAKRGLLKVTANGPSARFQPIEQRNPSPSPSSRSVRHVWESSTPEPEPAIQQPSSRRSESPLPAYNPLSVRTSVAAKTRQPYNCTQDPAAAADPSDHDVAWRLQFEGMYQQSLASQGKDEGLGEPNETQTLQSSSIAKGPGRACKAQLTGEASGTEGPPRDPHWDLPRRPDSHPWTLQRQQGNTTSSFPHGKFTVMLSHGYEEEMGPMQKEDIVPKQKANIDYNMETDTLTAPEGLHIAGDPDKPSRQRQERDPASNVNVTDAVPAESPDQQERAKPPPIRTKLEFEQRPLGDVHNTRSGPRWPTPINSHGPPSYAGPQTRSQPPLYPPPQRPAPGQGNPNASYRPSPRPPFSQAAEPNASANAPRLFAKRMPMAQLYATYTRRPMAPPTIPRADPVKTKLRQLKMDGILLPGDLDPKAMAVLIEVHHEVAIRALDSLAQIARQRSAVALPNASSYITETVREMMQGSRSANPGQARPQRPSYSSGPSGGQPSQGGMSRSYTKPDPAPVRGPTRKGGASWDNLQPDSPSNNVPGGFMVVQGEWDIDPKTQVQKNQVTEGSGDQMTRCERQAKARIMASGLAKPMLITPKSQQIRGWTS